MFCFVFCFLFFVDAEKINNINGGKTDSSSPAGGDGSGGRQKLLLKSSGGPEIKYADEAGGSSNGKQQSYNMNDVSSDSDSDNDEDTNKMTPLGNGLPNLTPHGNEGFDMHISQNVCDDSRPVSGKEAESYFLMRHSFQYP